MTTNKIKTTKFKEPSPNAQQFIDGAGGIDTRATQIDLKRMTLEELADRADTIAKQSYDLLGMICLEARERFQSNAEFGNWRRSVEGLAGYSNQHISDLINRSRFALTHDMTGISLSASFEIAAPVNQDVAEEVWHYCKRKNLKVEDVKRKIAQAKAILTIDKQEVPSKEEPAILERFNREESSVKVIPVIGNIAQEEDKIIETVMVGVELHGGGIEVSDEEVESAQMTYEDYAFEIDKFAQSIHMSDFVGIKVYGNLVRKLQERVYRK